MKHQILLSLILSKEHSYGVDDEIIRRSQILREKNNLKPQDSIHLSCAIEQNISEIIADDADFEGIKEIKRIPVKQ